MHKTKSKRLLEIRKRKNKFFFANFAMPAPTCINCDRHAQYGQNSQWGQAFYVSL